MTYLNHRENGLISNRIGPYDPSIASCVFLFISSIIAFQSFIRTDFKIFKQKKNSSLDYMRWLDYAITAPLMQSTLVLICGDNNLTTFMAVFALTSSYIVIGMASEYLKNIDITFSKILNYIAFLFFIVPFVIMVLSLSLIANVPSFVFMIVAVLFVQFLLFGVIHTLYLNSPGGYLRACLRYTLLGCTSKLNLAILVHLGTRNYSLAVISGLAGGINIAAAIVFFIFNRKFNNKGR
jgi:hypothetical protein